MGRNVGSLPVKSPEDGGTRGWVRVDRDRIPHTVFCITIDTQQAFLSPREARAFASTLNYQADVADHALRGQSDD